ncbi:MAG: MerR family transcriptional regulator, partial [Candidatus Levyibacteriota bacterium]
MDSARPGDPKKLFTIQEAAHKLAVSVDVLLEWNESHILKPTITSTGEIGYTENQLNKFQQIQRTLLTPTKTEVQSKSEEAKPGRAHAAPEEPIVPPVQPSRNGLYRRFINWIGNGFYEDEFIKEHLKSQVRQSLTLHVRRPSRKTFIITTIILFAIMSAGINQEYRFKFLFDKVNYRSNQAESGVLGTTTSKLKLGGNVTFALPVILKQDVTAKKNVSVGGNVSVGKNLTVQGTGTFTGNLTAPNILYSVVAGNNVSLTGDKQNPTINVDIPVPAASVNSLQGKTGDLKLTGDNGIQVSGLTITDSSTLAQIVARGHCASCLIDADISNSLTLGPGSNIDATAVNSGVLSTGVGGTGLTSYNTGDILFASDSKTLASLPIGNTNGQILQVKDGIPAWSTLALDATGNDALYSGANLVGVYNNFTNANSNNLQTVLDQFDSSITSAGTSPFLTGTDVTGNFIGPQLLDASDNFVLGGSTPSTGSLFFTAGTANLALGKSNSLNGSITFNSSGNTITPPTIASNANGDLLISNANVGIGTAPTDVDADNNPFALEVHGSIGPDVNNVYDLGSPTKQYRNLYLTGQTTSGGNITIANASPAINFIETDNSNYQFSIATDNSQFAIINNTNGTNDLVINNNGDVLLAGGSASTGCTITNANGNLACSGGGTFSGNVIAGTGLSLTSGVLNLNATSGSLALGGLSASSINTGTNALTITSSNFNTTATGINGTAIGATTPSTGAFTTLTDTGLTTVGVVVNNASGVLATQAQLDVLKGGTGIDGSAAGNGTLLIGNGTGYTLTTLTGTPNQVNVTNAAGAIILSTPQDIAMTSSPIFGGLSLTNGSNQLVLGGAGHDVTFSVNFQTNPTTITIPNLSASDTLVLANQTQTLSNKTIGSTGLIFSGAGTDITTPSGEDLTLTAGGTNEIVLGSTVQLSSLPGAPASATSLCRDNTTNQIVQCPANANNTTLQLAYDTGNTITTTTGRDIAFTLASGLATPTSFTLANNGNATGFALTNAGTGSAFVINDTNAATNTALAIQSNSVTSLSINENGTLSTTGNISTTGSGTVTSAGLLTASNGLTVTTGAVNLTGTSGAIALSSLGASSISTGTNAFTITSSNFNTTATGINGTAIGATTPSTGAFTTISANALNTAGVVINNASGVLATEAQLNVSRGGTGINGSAAVNGSLLIGNGSGYTLSTLTGTLHQVNVTNGSGSITLSLPQDIDAAATPTFASQTLSATTNQLVLGTTNTTTISSLAPGSSVTATIPALSSSDTFVFANEAQTLTNKTLTDASTLFQDDVDPTKKALFKLDNLDVNTTTTYTLPNVNGDATFCVTGAGGSNCAGTGGVVGGQGDQYRLPKFTDAGVGSNIGDSNLSDNGTVITTLSGLNIGDQSGTDTLSLLRSANATAGSLTKNSNLLTLQGSYWNGLASTNLGFSLQDIVTNNSPPGNKLSFQNDAGSEIASLNSTGNLTLSGTLAGATGITSSGTVTFSGLSTNGAVYTTAGGVLNSEAQLNVARGGTGVNGSAAANGSLLIGNGTGFSLATIGGTTDQVNVTNGAGTISLSLPQSIATTSTPSFTGLTLTSGLTFNNVATDITTGSNEDLTLSPNGTGSVVLATSTKLNTLPSTLNLATTVCRDNTTNQLVECPANAANVDLQQAYQSGNTISASDAYGNIDFTLAASSTREFTLTNAGTGSSAFVINDTNAATQTAFSIESNGTPNLTIGENGNIATNGTLSSGAITTSGTLTFSGLTPQITTTANANLTLAPSGTGEIVLGKTTQLNSLSTTTNTATTVCRDDTTNELVACPANAAGVSLQLAYNAGNTITTTDGRNIDFTLASGLTTATSFNLINNGNATGLNLTNAGTGNAVVINDTNAGTNIALAIKSNGTPTLTINENGVLSTTGSLSTTGTGTITSAGLLTASNGFTQTTGALNLTATSGALALSGLGASSINTGVNNLLITSGNFNTTATGINGTPIGADAASTGNFTTLSASGATTLSSLSTAGVVINNASGLLSTEAQLNVSRGGTGLNGATATNGTLLIGNGSGYSLATLTGTNNQVNVTNGAGSITLSLPQNIDSTATPTFASQTLSATTNQLILGNTNTTTISSLAPSSSVVATIPALSADDTFIFAGQVQTLNNKSIGTSGLVFSNAATDITTGTDENLTIAPNGIGQIILSNVTQLPNLSPTVGATVVCRNSSDQLSVCSSNALNVTLQQAYNSGNTITTTDGRNIDFTLGSGLTTQTSFSITNAGTGSAFILNDTNAATNTSLAIQSNGVNKLTVNENGNLVTTGTLASQATSNQVVLGNTNTTTISALASTAPRTATIPALTADDTFVFANQGQTLSNKTIGSTGLIFSGATTDISTPNGEDLTLTAGGTANIVLSSITQVPNLSATVGGTVVCRNSSNQLSVCSSNALNVTLQQAYNSGNTITTTDGRSIAFTLASGLTTPTSFNLTNNGNATGFALTNAGTGSAFVVNDSNAATNTLLALQSNGITNFAVDETGTLTTNGNITQSGATTFSTGTGAISLNGSTSVTGTNAFSVGTGATTLGGTLGVTGNTSLSTVSTSGLATLNSASITNNAAVGGTLGVTGNTTLASGAGATFTAGNTTGAVNVNGSTVAITANGTGDGIILNLADDTSAAFSASESAHNYIAVNTGNGAENITFGNAITNPAYIFAGAGGATFGSTLGVTGATTLSSTLGVTGLATLSGGASISSGLNNNGGGITNAGAISGATTISSGAITTTGTLTFNGVATDITTGTNEDLTVAPNGNGQIILSNTVQLGSLPTPSANPVKTLCRDSVTQQIIECSANAAGVSLQLAYNAGNTITTTDGRNIAVTLGSGLTTQTSFSITNAGTGSAFILNDTNAATNTSLAIQSNGTPTLTINENGVLSTPGNLSTTGTGTITSAQLLTASNGFTQTSGALNLTATSGTLALSGLSASSIDTGANNLLITSGSFTTTATGINST